MHQVKEMSTEVLEFFALGKPHTCAADYFWPNSLPSASFSYTRLPESGCANHSSVVRVMETGLPVLHRAAFGIVTLRVPGIQVLLCN